MVAVLYFTADLRTPRDWTLLPSGNAARSGVRRRETAALREESGLSYPHHPTHAPPCPDRQLRFEGSWSGPQPCSCNPGSVTRARNPRTSRRNRSSADTSITDDARRSRWKVSVSFCRSMVAASFFTAESTGRGFSAYRHSLGIAVPRPERSDRIGVLPRTALPRQTAEGQASAPAETRSHFARLGLRGVRGSGRLVSVRAVLAALVLLRLAVPAIPSAWPHHYSSSSGSSYRTSSSSHYHRDSTLRSHVSTSPS